MTRSINNTEPGHSPVFFTECNEQDLPHGLQLKRARSKAGLYRLEIQSCIYQYRMWLAKSEYLRVSGLCHTPRTNSLHINRIRAMWNNYREQQKILHQMQRQQDSSLHSANQAEEIYEQALHEYLELRYGIAFAENVMTEMRKVKSDIPPQPILELRRA